MAYVGTELVRDGFDEIDIEDYPIASLSSDVSVLLSYYDPIARVYTNAPNELLNGAIVRLIFYDTATRLVLDVHTFHVPEEANIELFGGI